MHVFEKNIKELGITLLGPPVAIANYVPFKITDKFLYVSGQGPIKDGSMKYTGKVGKDISIEDGIKAAELCCMNILAAIRHAIEDDWNKFVEIIKLGGFVNCNSDFTDQPKIINGASDLLVKIFGDQGKHSRFAVGSNTLPLNIAVEIEAVIKLK